MSQHTGPTLAHRSVASIRHAPSSSQPIPSSPHTPPRTISSTYGSPSTIRAEEDIVVIQPGSRFIRAGFAGEALPKAVLECGPDEQRRVGDFRQWLNDAGVDANEQKRRGWASEREIWRCDLRDVDLGLVQDKLERTLREAFTKYLLIDSRPRRVGLVLDSGLPLPLLSALLDTLFTKFSTPVVSLLSSAVMTTVGAGVRSGLIVDVGWQETVVTSVYEYREVKTTRSIRGGRRLLDQLYKTLCSILGEDDSEEDADGPAKGESGSRTAERIRRISFEECEDVMYRLMWCRASASKSSQRHSAQLETVEEQDESEAETSTSPQLIGEATVPFQSTSPPRNVKIPMEKLADTCDEAFFSPSMAWDDFDDNELPVHVLVYQHLLHLPVDARANCMARIMFAGGCSNILGLRERVFDELNTIVERRGWDPVTGKAVDKLRENARLSRPVSTHTNPDGTLNSPTGPLDSPSTTASSVASAAPLDPAASIEAKILKNRPVGTQIQGELRALHSVGAWAGASLVCQLKTGAVATIESQQWLQHGVSGAVRPGEVDHKAQQRQSVGGGGMWRGGAGGHQSWTLGTWGYL